MNNNSIQYNFSPQTNHKYIVKIQNKNNKTKNLDLPKKQVKPPNFSNPLTKIPYPNKILMKANVIMINKSIIIPSLQVINNYQKNMETIMVIRNPTIKEFNLIIIIKNVVLIWISMPINNYFL
jgi:hypothetical protein